MGRYLQLAAQAVYAINAKLPDSRYDKNDINDQTPSAALDDGVGDGHGPLANPFCTPDELHERADIAEFDAGVPREWAEGYATLRAAHPPKGISPTRWKQIIDDAGRFIDKWGAQAARLGWATNKVFGVHPTHPEQRIDQKGLVMLLRGRPVIAITADSATIQADPKSTQRAFRKAATGRVPVWELGG